MSRPVFPSAAMLAAVAAGGAVGALLRWALLEVAPDGPGFPWTTFAINVSGSLALALAAAVLPPHRQLLALALGPGVLGGYTTFSAYAEEGRRLLDEGAPGLAVGYLAGTLIACVVAVRVAGVLVNRRRQDLVT